MIKKLLIFLSSLICVFLIIIGLLFYLYKAEYTFMGKTYTLINSYKDSNAWYNTYLKIWDGETDIAIIEFPYYIPVDEYEENIKNSISNEEVLNFEEYKISNEKIIVNYVEEKDLQDIKYLEKTYAILISNPNKNSNMLIFRKRYYLYDENSVNEIQTELKKDKELVNSALKEVKLPKIRKYKFKRKLEQYTLLE